MKNSTNSLKETCQQLSLLQLKKDCEAMINLTKDMLGNGILSNGINPYMSVLAAAIMEVFDKQEIVKDKEVGLSLKDLRLKVKLFEDGYSKSEQMILNIDYLQDQCFKRKLRFSFLGHLKLHNNLGVYKC